jgi:GT2 family glycosyltransferase
MSPVLVIIPAYRGVDATKRCLQSVLTATCVSSLDILVINDASPEPALSAMLDELATVGSIRLICHSENRGFVASCNVGLAQSQDQDVVLLNSDTEVSDGWLDRLLAAAASRENVASVSPFSNNATINSYPCIGKSNSLPDGKTTAEMAALFADCNRGSTVEVPTAVGFCMLMKAKALKAVGNLDEAAFGRGYGEENDWCLRASAMGYVHLLCADAFVYPIKFVLRPSSMSVTRTITS